MADFFKKDEIVDDTPIQDQPQEPDKIKLGDESYTQDELQSLVGLGKIAKESEEKYNRPIGKFWPEYTKTKQENDDLKQQLEESKKVEQQIDNSSLTGEQKLLAKNQLQELLGGEPVTKKEFEEAVGQKIQGILAARDLIEDTEMAVEEAKETYGIKTTTEEVLTYMSENGFKKPDKAIKDMFEETVDKYKAEQLMKIKPQGLETTSTSQAGVTRTPEQVTLNKDNLAQALRDYVSKRGVQ